jgi:hypothetical protein
VPDFMMLAAQPFKVTVPEQSFVTAMLVNMVDDFCEPHEALLLAIDAPRMVGKPRGPALSPAAVIVRAAPVVRH